jgi:2-iminoacetate synthase
MDAAVPEDGGLLPARADFLIELAGLRLEEMLRAAEGAGPGAAGRALSGSLPDLDDVAVLLSAPRERLQEDLAEAAFGATVRGFGRSILLYAPCYLSSYCVNHCRYCGFNFTMPITRRWLDPDRAIGEISHLAGRGFRRVLLVAGEAPAMVDTGYLQEVIRRSRELVPEIDLEVGPVGEKEYRCWNEAGAGGVVCYQETYDRLAYAWMHPRGPKRRYEFRLRTPERAARAGMTRLGLGVLVGLGDPRRDILSLIAHARFLERTFPHARITVSLPRLCHAVPSFEPAGWVGDDEMLRLFCVLRLALPRAGMIVTTREPDRMRTLLLRRGVTQMSAESLTVPGAYLDRTQDGGQFEVHDQRTVEEVVAELTRLGYEARWTSDGASGAGPSPGPVTV